MLFLDKEGKHIVSLHRKEDYPIPYYASLFKGRWYNIKSHYSVADIWNTSEITQDEAISQWISMHL